jgi:hypothetical protein
MSYRHLSIIELSHKAFDDEFEKSFLLESLFTRRRSSILPTPTQWDEVLHNVALCSDVHYPTPPILIQLEKLKA